jgi:hypothetical protein
MKLTFFTTQKNSPATIFYLYGLKSLPGLQPYSTSWGKLDIALIMGFREDLEFVQEAKRINPRIKVGLIDPRGRYIDSVRELIDFLIVDSLEMIDFFAQYSLPIFQYYEYFPVKPLKKNHSEKENIVIGYHGNKVHLMSMWPGVSEALNRLAKDRKVTLKVIYNIEKIGKWEVGCPENIKVEHVQLREETYESEIHSCDIGIVPAFSPVPKSIYKPSFVERKVYLLDEDDYVLRFKVPSNAGRVIVFALLGVPVVADMLPSSCQFIQHGYNGFLAYSSGGWYKSLLQLIDSSELRNEFSERLQKHAFETVDYEKQNIRLKDFLESDVCRGHHDYLIPNINFERQTIPGINIKYITKKLLEGRGKSL